MSDRKIAKVVLGLPISKPFDYSIPVPMRGKIKVGCRVKVIFNKRKLTGYVYGLSRESRIKKLSPVISLLDEAPILSSRMLNFLGKAASYYFASAGEMIEAALPLALREGKILGPDELICKSPDSKVNQRPGRKPEVKPYIYCSGNEEKKRQFFVDKISQALKDETRVIFLLPDTSLVCSWQNRLKSIFPAKRIVVFHSRLSKKEAFLSWLAIRNQDADIVIGSRQAILCPMDNLGLIIVDFEDNFVYKQETRPYYHARDIAIILAKEAGAGLILSSISPSVDVFYEATKRKFSFFEADNDEKGGCPSVRIFDLKAQRAFRKGNIFPAFIFERIYKSLEQKKKILIFLNRRGFATYVRCRHCGFVLRCNRCSAGLVYHYQKKDLHCPYCNYSLSGIDKCPQCGLPLVYFGGLGVEKIESEAYRLFPAAKIAFIDSQSHIENIDALDIIIVTAAGLKEDLIKEKKDVCVVVSIDNMLNFAQLRSSEEAFRLLRRLKNLCTEEMIIETYYPEHRVFKSLVSGGYRSFAREELVDRKALGLPPYRHITSINLKGIDEEKLNKCARDLFAALAKKIDRGNFEVFEPIKDMPYRLRSKFRLQILIKAAKVESMNAIINRALSELKTRHGVIITVNVDI